MPSDDLLGKLFDAWYRSTAERKLKRDEDSPLTSLHPVRKIAPEATKEGQRPALLIAPLIGEGVEGSWSKAVRDAYLELPHGDDTGPVIGIFNKPLQRDETHVRMIARGLRTLPVILVHGAIGDGEISVRIESWGFLRRKRCRRRVEVFTDRLTVPSADRRQAARDTAVLCAQVAECFHAAHGRPPLRHLTGGTSGWAKRVSQSMEAGLQQRLFRPLEYCADDDRNVLRRLAAELGEETAAVFAFNTYMAALSAFQGLWLKCEEYRDRALATITGSTYHLQAFASLDTALEEAGQANTHLPERCATIIRDTHRAYGEARDALARRRISG